MSDQKPPLSSLSPAARASSTSKSRDGSVASLSSEAPPQIDRGQLSHAFDQIHSTSQKKDILTTFKALGPPPSPSSAVEGKGTASDLVQNGLSGLYSRFKEVVGVGGKDKKENPDLNDGDAASRKSSSTTATASKKPGSLLHVDTGVTSSTFNSTSPDPTASAITSSDAVSISEGQSQQPYSTMASSVSNLPGAPNLKSTSSSFQSMSSMTKPTAAVVPVHASAFKDGPRGVLSKTEDSQIKGGGRRSISKPNDGQHSATTSEVSTVHDAVGKRHGPPVDKIPVPSHPKREDGPNMEGSTNSPTTPLRGYRNPPVMLPAATSPPSDSGALPQSIQPSTRDAIRRPALLDRIGYSRPSDNLSRSSSISRGTTENSPINTSAHDSIHHESFTQVPEPRQMKSGEYRIPGTTVDEGARETVNAKLASMRKQILSKDFWMADETCKECFLCAAPFTAFRRKHHCRTCGCIFDNGCTSIISGERFGVQGTLRVCQTCLAIIRQRQDGPASDDSADDSFLPAMFRQNVSKTHPPPPKAERDYPSASERVEDIENRSLATPLMAIPAARRIGESSNRNSAVLEIDSPQLSRPSSSRSLRSSNTSGKPQPFGHRRHHSKHNLWNRLKTSPEQRAPFRKLAGEEVSRKAGMHAFHDDNVIDPDLAPFMSDESSGDEQMSIAEVMGRSDLQGPAMTDPERSFGSYLSAGRRAKNRAQVEKSVSGLSFTSRGLDEFHPRPSRRRNMSIASGHVVRSPRPKSSALRGPIGSNETLPLLDTSLAPDVRRITRSSSMKGDKAPRLELNPASLVHVRKLLRQLLQDTDVPNVSSWEKALMPILLTCTASVDPDIERGDDMDIRHYVKLKKIPGGRPGDTCYVPGVIFTKKLALKSMPRRMANPRVVIVSFPIEYHRHQQQFMSLQPVIEQEREYLKQLVNRIIALRPQLLLAEKSVAGLAMQFLSDAKIVVVCNVKPSVLTAVSRCLETEIISSIDMLALPSHQFQPGRSPGYEVKTFVNEHIPGRKKTYIFVSSSQEELGCTIALRGAPIPVLAKLKRITEFMVYVVYNLKLESCLMRDSFIQLPTSEELSGHSSQAMDESLGSLATKRSSTADDGQRSTSTTTQDTPNSQDSHSAPGIVEESPSSAVSQEPLLPQPAHDSAVPEDIPMPSFYSDMVAKYETKILSVSPFVKFAQPYLLMKAREQERRLVHLKRLRDQDIIDERADPEKSNPQKFQLIKPRMVLETGHKAPRQIMEILHAVHDAEYDKAFYNYQTQTRQWENNIQGNIGLFEPYAHQRIVVLHSIICTETKIPCLEPTLIAFGFYDEHVDFPSGMSPDCTLGQYIEDVCYNSDDLCKSNNCDRKMGDHHRTYVHGESLITIFVEPDTKGTLRDDIMMWSYCRLCRRETNEKEMSRETWKYSFGKYLELSFLSRGTHLVEVEDGDGWNCPHDHHRNHIRYFAVHDKIIRIHHDPVELLEIIVPRARITWNVEHDLNMKNDIFSHAQERWARFTTSVKARLKAINIDNIVPEKVDSCKAEMERLSKKISEDHSSLVRKLQEKYMNSKYYEVIPFNVVLREMLVKVGEWDAVFTKFEADFLPSDKDIRRLTLIHLRKMFTDESKESLPNNETINETTEITEEATQSSIPESDTRTDSQPTTTDSDPAQLDADQEQAPLDVPVPDATPVHVADEALDRVEPLDLATPKIPAHDRPVLSRPEGGIAAFQAQPLPNPDPVLPSPELTPKSTTTAAPSVSSNEKVEQIRRRQSGSSERVGVTATRNEPTRVSVEPPKAVERGTSRKAGSSVSPPMIRALSQPVISAAVLPRVHSAAGKKMFSTNKEKDRVPSSEAGTGNEIRKISSNESGKGEKKIFPSLRPHRKTNPSAIPRFVGKRDSRVFTIRKHFEQLSREFEKERVKDREKRAVKMSHSRPFLQNSSTKAILEVYEDVVEAVQEPGPIEEDQVAVAGKLDLEGGMPTESAEPETPSQTSQEPVQEPQSPKDVSHISSEMATETETDDPAQNNSLGATDDEQGESDTEHSLIDGTTLEEIAESFDSSAEIPAELPKQDKNNFMKVLANFWNERSASQWPPLDYPLNATDHIFIDSDIIVREDEPSSLIAFALSSEDYKERLRGFYPPKSNEDTDASSVVEGDGHPDDFPGAKETITKRQLEVKLMHNTGTHYKYQFTEGTAKMLIKIFYAEQFDALRRSCGVADRIVESLSRCLKWDSKGGKTKSVFLKTQDDRLVMKSLSPVETVAFLKFAPAYFSLMAEALFHDLPSVIAKMLGFFQVVIRNPVTNTEIKLDLLLMENLFYDRAPSRIFDLKGSMRNRKIQATGEQNEVLLDENMVEYIYESPLFAREHSKKLLRASVWNDTLFLARQNVMDYSLMVAIDEDKKELVVGIIDCIRTYTWDKKLESWIKDRGFAGGGRNKPTVTSPKEYKSRFREAMARYILEAPNCWHPFSAPVLAPRPREVEVAGDEEADAVT
ncbi:hypothetical protein GGS23DRAFT_467344 [Durotheca rogersii]|uniref:uncharacterized protein n=1 Tax=Durotheca rogersii TaxID=419775 RepID=UPI002220D7FF|nr:uncharacterized protein GGS23DRAFT_467344 [Durotheca rogersii]KAI5864874.1 hypothetical protein GGS23DRAFT_467344 [Durotheca rogersii]